MMFLTPAEEMASVRRAAQRAGCVVRELAIQQTSMGPRAVGKLTCRDGWGAARLLLAQAIEDSETAGARDVALALRRDNPRDEDFARAVHAYVKRNVAFVREQGEVFTGSAYTLGMRGGDCDDHARLVYALARAGGLGAVLAFLHCDPPEDEPTHAVAQLCVDGRCQWAETTVDAFFGEHPLAAAGRLGLLDEREDLAKGVRIMSEKSLGSQEEADARALATLGFLVCPDDRVTPDIVKDAQRSMGGGLVVDGILGPKTRRAIAIRLPQDEFGMGYLAALGAESSHTADLSDDFFSDLKTYAAELQMDPVWMLDVMYSESGLRSTAKFGGPDRTQGNPKGILSTGLIGFMDVRLCGTPDNSRAAHDRFAQVSPEGQLQCVRQFWLPMKGKARSAANLYQYNFVPASLARGTDDDTVIAAEDGVGYHGQEADFYRVNAGYLDVDKNGAITVGDLAARLEKSKHIDNDRTKPLQPRYAEALARLGVSASAPSSGGGLSGVVVGGVLLLAVGLGAAIGHFR